MSLEEAFKEIGFSLGYNDAGNIDSLSFSGAEVKLSKYNCGDEMVFFEAISNYVSTNSYLSFKGDDGYKWNLLFREKELRYGDYNDMTTWEEEYGYDFECFFE